MNTKEKLISTTANLIQTKGYYGTGVSEILSSVGVPKGSLYHHLPGGKDELVSEALKYAAYKRAKRFSAAMKGKGSASQGLIAVVEVVQKELIDSNFRKGCPVTTVSLEIANENEELRETCEHLFQFWLKAVEDYLIYKNVENWNIKANSYFTQLEGALLLSKVFKSASFLDKLKEAIPKMIEG